MNTFEIPGSIPESNINLSFQIFSSALCKKKPLQNCLVSYYNVQLAYSFLSHEMHCNFLPNQREALLLRYMIDTDLAQLFRRNTLAWFEQIYLQTDFDLLGEGTLRENCLHLRHHGAGHHAALRSDGVHLLADARDDRKVLREVVRHEATDSATSQLVQLG